MLARRIISVVLFCLYIAAVAYLCFAKPEDMPQLSQTWFGLPSDKVGHFLMFLPYPLLSFHLFRHDEMTAGRQILLLAVLMVTGAGLAAGSEQIQASLGYRSADTHDLIADMAGLTTGGLCILCYILFRRRR